MGFVKPGRKIGGLVLFYKSMVKRLKGFLSFFFFFFKKRFAVTESEQLSCSLGLCF